MKKSIFIKVILENKFSFSIGALLSLFLIFFLWVMQIAEGHGPYFDDSDLIVQLGFPRGLLYETLNLPFQKYGIDIPFFPFWMIIGGYLCVCFKYFVIAICNIIKK